MNMQEYREKIKFQNYLVIIAGLVLAGFCFLAAYSEFSGLELLRPAAGDSHFASLWRGFFSGASFGLLALLLLGLIRNLLALRNEETLRKRYIKDNDEREIRIWTSARAVSSQIVLLFGLVAAVCVSYFYPVVGITILACVFIQSLVILGAVLVFRHKM